MKRLLASLAVVLALSASAVRAQSLSKLSPLTVSPDSSAERVIKSLQRLEDDVIVYRSLGEFEANGHLARVPLKTFETELQLVVDEVTPVLSQMSDDKLRRDLVNALDSFSDGAFRWRQIDQPRVINVSALSSIENKPSAADSALLATVPYTIAIHWRQAHTFLNRARKLSDLQPNRHEAQETLR
jgi:hypothetical protein